MPRDGSGIYSKPADTTAVAGQKIESAKFNLLIDDIAADLNSVRPVTAGGTGTTSIALFKTAFGLKVGTDIQAYNADLTAIAGLTSAADRLPYYTGSGTAGLATFTSFGRSLVDDPDAATARATMGLATIGQAEAEAGTATTTRAFTAQRVKQAIEALATGVLSAQYESAEQSVIAGGLLTLAHSLGAIPKLVQIWMICKVADAGFAIGDTVVISPDYNSDNGGNEGHVTYVDATNVYVRTGNGSILFLNKTGTTWVGINKTSWRYIVRAWV